MLRSGSADWLTTAHLRKAGLNELVWKQQRSWGKETYEKEIKMCPRSKNTFFRFIPGLTESRMTEVNKRSAPFSALTFKTVLALFRIVSNLEDPGSITASCFLCFFLRRLNSRGCCILRFNFFREVECFTLHRNMDAVAFPVFTREDGLTDRILHQPQDGPA